jgi:predicted RNA methylase
MVLIVGLLFAVIIAFLVWLIWPTIIGAPWVPTPRKVAKRMLELADVQETDVVIDLGSGDGRIIMIAANDYNARTIGIEADPIRLLWSRINISRKGLSERATVFSGNFFHKDLGEATVVTIYQTQEINNKLKPKLEKELKPGTRVVSHAFTFNGWEPKTVDRESQLYLYIV